MEEVVGVVTGVDGSPIEGVLVMGVDLNYAETNAQGEFRVRSPEAALVFWCTGFRPMVRVLPRQSNRIDVVLMPQ